MKYDNPAERLMVILAAGLKRKENESCIAVWHDLLGSAGDNSLLMGRLGKLMELPQQIIEALQEADPDGEPTWQDWAGQVNRAFVNQNLSANWQTFRQHINANTVNFLRLSSLLLHSKVSIDLLTPEKLSELRKSIDDMVIAVSDSEISADLKKYIVHHLKKVINAIDEYKITGAITMLESVEVMYGHLFSDPDYRAFVFKSELGKKLREVLSDVSSVVTIATGVPQIGHFMALLASHS